MYHEDASMSWGANVYKYIKVVVEVKKSDPILTNSVFQIILDKNAVAVIDKLVLLLVCFGACVSCVCGLKLCSQLFHGIARGACPSLPP